MDAARLKTVGIYLIVLLGIVRLLIMPLQDKVREKKALLAEYQQLFNTRQALVQKQASAARRPLPATDEETIKKLFYPRDVATSAVQTEILKELVQSAEKKRLSVLNFELPDVIPGKGLTEIPILLRLQGEALGTVELLKEIETSTATRTVRSFEAAKRPKDVVSTIVVSAFRIEK